jgi:predicted ribosomally synthesized peptide with SipW-like signal peptide
MKYFIALMTAILIAVVLASFNDNEQVSNEPVTGLPWQIDRLPNGDTRVFEITLGRTTLGEAIELLGDDEMDLAIIAAPRETGTLEAYFSHYSAGPITGKLFLMLDIAPDILSPMRKRAFQDGGTRKYHLHPDDLPAAYRAPVSVMNFIPSFNLDEEIAQARFGTPDEIIQIDAQQKHWLYPDKGLDLILNVDNKDVLQYLSPGQFSAHRAQLQQ